ncbi:hypothetical protein PHYSODRAFT_324273 [Phytophthora sojae]|uniref:Uncharacterized protein n=1 Tax=Phytophthora sojae (strain P6497) TaxID=1094619 RepID=G4YSJ1_PHYSP|nr:hypothetical protein PHYSODRAFT_324273 [Phytophthora sojae]EGZ23007.1 hypothetical protein PHYSODRAFT_324273 [Phytophthora sojae]|eukprot:XP_009518295.1 hypothetical protein PHYSODRAFT_324273 [Phytophthora sojae]
MDEEENAIEDDLHDSEVNCPKTHAVVESKAESDKDNQPAAKVAGEDQEMHVYILLVCVILARVCGSWFIYLSAPSSLDAWGMYRSMILAEHDKYNAVELEPVGSCFVELTPSMVFKPARVWTSLEGLELSSGVSGESGAQSGGVLELQSRRMFPSLEQQHCSWD